MWNGIGGKPKVHLVKWAKVCKPLQVGGVGYKMFGKLQFCLARKMVVEVWHGDLMLYGGGS